MPSGIDDIVTFTGRALPVAALDPASGPDDPTAMRSGFAWLPGGPGRAEQSSRPALAQLLTKVARLAAIGAPAILIAAVLIALAAR
jgi:hypothetical protein